VRLLTSLTLAYTGAVESALPTHRHQAELLLTQVLQERSVQPSASVSPHAQGQDDEESLVGSRSTFRLGIAGPPGAGKSTFIEALGLFLVNRGHRPAILAIGA